MKKLLFLSVMCLLVFNAAAQPPKTHIGIKGGLNLATISTKSDNALNIDKTQVIPAFNVGLMADIPLGGKAFSFMPTLSLSGKGTKSELLKLSDSNYGTVKYSPYYLDLQTNIVLNIPVSDKFKIFIGAGPYFGAGLFGKAKVEGKIFGVDVSKEYDITFTKNEDDISATNTSGFANMKGMDLGASIIGGVTIGKIMFSANYEHGLVNVYPGTSDNKDNFGKNRCVSLSVGVFF